MTFHPPEVNFLPGPVAVSRDVRRAFEQAPESHRAEAFIKDFGATKQVLCELVRAAKVELFLGSGTLANDIVGMSRQSVALQAIEGEVPTPGELLDHPTPCTTQSCTSLPPPGSLPRPR